LVEAAGQRFHIFRYGLDYTFILPWQDAGRIIHRIVWRWILVPAPSWWTQPVY